MSFLSLATTISPLRGYHYIYKLLINEKNVPLSSVGAISRYIETKKRSGWVSASGTSIEHRTPNKDERMIN